MYRAVSSFIGLKSVINIIITIIIKTVYFVKVTDKVAVRVKIR